MKEYKETVHADGQVNEPVAAYSASASQETVIPGLSDEILNELLQQKESVKLMLIHKLAESMMDNRYAEKSVALEETGNKDLMECHRMLIGRMQNWHIWKKSMENVDESEFVDTQWMK